MSKDPASWPTECIHRIAIGLWCEECDKAGRTNAAEYGAYEPLIRPERVRELEEILMRSCPTAQPKETEG